MISDIAMFVDDDNHPGLVIGQILITDNLVVFAVHKGYISCTRRRASSGKVN